MQQSIRPFSSIYLILFLPVWHVWSSSIASGIWCIKTLTTRSVQAHHLSATSALHLACEMWCFWYNYSLSFIRRLWNETNFWQTNPNPISLPPHSDTIRSLSATEKEMAKRLGFLNVPVNKWVIFGILCSSIWYRKHLSSSLLLWYVHLYGGTCDILAKSTLFLNQVMFLFKAFCHHK